MAAAARVKEGRRKRALPSRSRREPTADNGLLAALAALDRILAIGVERQASRLGAESLTDPWRGMHLQAEDVRTLLADVTPQLNDDASVPDVLSRLAIQSPAVARMAALLALEPVDIAVVVLALAPEVDLRYERIYAYLQDDVTRKRPTADLACNLLCPDRPARLQLIHRLGPRGLLRRKCVLDASRDGELPMPSRPLVLDVSWRNRLLACDEIDSRLADIAWLRSPDRKSVV